MLRELIQQKSRHAIEQRLSTKLKAKPGGCIEVDARLDRGGYPRMNFRFDGKHVTVRVYRLIWVLTSGRNIPCHMTVDHKCQNTLCINPLHLQLKTNENNVAIRYTRKRRIQIAEVRAENSVLEQMKSIGGHAEMHQGHPSIVPPIGFTFCGLPRLAAETWSELHARLASAELEELS